MLFAAPRDTHLYLSCGNKKKFQIIFETRLIYGGHFTCNSNNNNEML